jgi:uncharacterized membrane protein YphA (DoxX/SURF4 family)
MWFGSSQLLQPDMWTTWVPEWTAVLGLDAARVVFLNGCFELLAGTLLLLGVYTRYVALVLFLHMLLVVYDIGLTAIGVRDFGLAAGFLALALDGRSPYSLVR